MQNHALTSFAIFLAFFSFNCEKSWAEQATDPKQHLHALKYAIANLKDYSVIHIQQERFDEELGPKMKMKVKYSKGRLYLRILEGPKKNAEVLFKPGWNDGKARVHRGSFPNLTVNVSPRGSLMMNKQHHSVEHLSFQHIGETLIKSALRCENLPGSGIQEVPNSAEKKEEASNITLELKAPAIEKLVTVLKDEDIWSFAKRMDTDPYLILYVNKLSDFDDVKEGKMLKSPLCYAPRTLLTLNRTTHLPVKLVTYDLQGNLYESYEWQQLNTSTPLSDMDFDPDNKEYDF